MNIEKKKRKKKDPYKLQKFKNSLIKAFLLELVIILFFSCAIYENRTPTEENTYQVTGKIEDYRIDRGRRHLNFYFWQNGVKYFLTEFHNVSRNDSYEKRITEIMKEEEITLTVIDTFRIGKTIVDIRSDTTIYHDIKDEQAYRKSQRTSAIIGFLLILVFYNVLASIPVLHWYEPPKRKQKKKPIKKEPQYE